MLCQRGTPSATLKLPDPLENACLISREGSSAFSGKFTSNPLGMIARSRSKRMRMFSNSSRETRLDHAVRVRPSQPPLGGDLVPEAFLHPLQMVRLKKQPLLPMDL